VVTSQSTCLAFHGYISKRWCVMPYGINQHRHMDLSNCYTSIYMNISSIHIDISPPTHRYVCHFISTFVVVYQSIHTGQYIVYRLRYSDINRSSCLYSLIGIYRNMAIYRSKYIDTNRMRYIDMYRSRCADISL
jgi:hypothetical protein